MKAGRNDPCPCGSGRKYKHCCGLLSAASGAAASVGPSRGSHGAGLASERDASEAQQLIDAANKLRASGKTSEAVPLYRRALELDARSAEAHNNLGNAFVEMGEPAEAAACYRRALALQDANPQILCNLTNALSQLGDVSAALAASERAVAADPGLSVAHHYRGQLLAAAGRREQAIASYRQALALNPRYVEALINLANLLGDLGEPSEAVSLYRKAIEADPRRASSHCSLGNVLTELGRLDEATVSFRQALALQSDYVQAQLGLGTAARMQGRTAEAEASCQAALAIEPQNVEALLLLGELRADRGRFSEAQQLFQRALAIDGESPFVYSSIVAHRKMTQEDSAWLTGVAALLARPLPLAQEIRLRYALGKYFDDLACYDEAFGSYRQANDLTRRYRSRYDPRKLTQRVDRIIGHFDAAFLRQRHSETDPSELPVFIIGMPRSGTSLTEQILASHPAVFGAGELPFWNRAFNTFEAASLKGDSIATLISAMAHDYLQRLRALSTTALRVVDKMPANFLYAGLIHAAFPRARIIHMQRDPRDTCLSIYFQNFFNMAAYANDLEHLAHYYREYLRITGHWRSLLPSSAFLEVPYESLVADQEGWTRRMVEFLGLPWDPKCLDFQDTERVVITASRWQVRQRITSASVGRWRNYEKHLGPLRHLTELPRTAAGAHEALRV
jgi:tetratricopeptide (TPR) repeat protein